MIVLWAVRVYGVYTALFTFIAASLLTLINAPPAGGEHRFYLVASLAAGLLLSVPYGQVRGRRTFWVLFVSLLTASLYVAAVLMQASGPSPEASAPADQTRGPFAEAAESPIEISAVLASNVMAILVSRLVRVRQGSAL